MKMVNMLLKYRSSSSKSKTTQIDYFLSIRNLFIQFLIDKQQNVNVFLESFFQIFDTYEQAPFESDEFALILLNESRLQIHSQDEGEEQESYPEKSLLVVLNGLNEVTKIREKHDKEI